MGDECSLPLPCILSLNEVREVDLRTASRLLGELGEDGGDVFGTSLLFRLLSRL